MTTIDRQLTENAKIAIQKDDRRAAFVLLRKALEQDVTNREAWQLLHSHFGQGEPIGEFQIAFTTRYLQKDMPVEQKTTARRPPRRFPRLFVGDPTTAGFVVGNIVAGLTIFAIYSLLQREPSFSNWILVPLFCSGLAGMAGTSFVIARLRRRTQSWQRYLIGICVGAISGLTVAPVILIGVGLVIQSLK